MLSRKYIYHIVYIFVILSMISCVYFMLWAPHIVWNDFRDPKENENEFDDNLLRRVLMRVSPYDRLMKYMLNPRATCKKSVILGGIRYPNNKLDGDKMLCLKPGPGLKVGNCIVYSFGVAYEWSFEESIHSKFGCEVFAFDPSMGVGDHIHADHIWFFNNAIGKFDGKLNFSGQTWNVKTFSTILNQMGHWNRTIDVLKMDIEGGEYEVLKNMLDDGLLKYVNHLCVELHLMTYPHWHRILELLRRVEAEAGLKLFSTRNNTQTKLLRVPGFSRRYEKDCFELAWNRQ